MKVLVCEEVSRTIGKRKIIDNISMEIEEGEIFGFLGPNGAGKTTTIRMITGLIAPTSGELFIMGHSLKTDRYKALSHVGAIVENPEMYNFLTGYENLRQLARIDDRITDDRIHEVVYEVGLSGRIHDKVKTYSLGMKQRLGLAQALMHKPKLLVLDEPSNGLDPAGIIEFRERIRRLAKEEGMAVFISSHILSEIEQLCDRVAIINHGIIQSIDRLHEDMGEDEWISITVRNPAAVKILLGEFGGIRKLQMVDRELMMDMDPRRVPEMIIFLAARGALIEQVAPKRMGLEQKFMQIVGGTKHAAVGL